MEDFLIRRLAPHLVETKLSYGKSLIGYALSRFRLRNLDRGPRRTRKELKTNPTEMYLSERLGYEREPKGTIRFAILSHPLFQLVRK